MKCFFNCDLLDRKKISQGPTSSLTEKASHIGPMVIEIIRYKHTDTHPITFILWLYTRYVILWKLPSVKSALPDSVRDGKDNGEWIIFYIFFCLQYLIDAKCRFLHMRLVVSLKVFSRAQKILPFKQNLKERDCFSFCAFGSA